MARRPRVLLALSLPFALAVAVAGAEDRAVSAECTLSTSHWDGSETRWREVSRTTETVAAESVWVTTRQVLFTHRHKIVIAGNHDRCFEADLDQSKACLPAPLVYLHDSGCELAGLRFWGAPWQPWFRLGVNVAGEPAHNTICDTFHCAPECS